MQLYVNADRSKTTQLLNSARSLGIRAIFVTVDAHVPGKREADERIAAEKVSSAISGAVASNDKKGGGMGKFIHLIYVLVIMTPKPDAIVFMIVFQPLT